MPPVVNYSGVRLLPDCRSSGRTLTIYGNTHTHEKGRVLLLKELIPSGVLSGITVVMCMSYLGDLMQCMQHLNPPSYFPAIQLPNNETQSHTNTSSHAFSQPLRPRAETAMTFLRATQGEPFKLPNNEQRAKTARWWIEHAEKWFFNNQTSDRKQENTGPTSQITTRREI